MSNVELSEGALCDIMQGGQISNPTVQILYCKKIQGGNENPSGRYRLLLSDGKYMISFAMLATQLNEMVEAKRLTNNTIITIKRYITTSIQTGSKVENRRILVILDLDIIASGDDVGMKIGEPVNLTPEQIAAGSSTVNNTSSNMSNSSTSTSVRSNTTVTPKKGIMSNSSMQSTSNSTNFDVTSCNPIENISPYQTNWVIKARVMNKSSIRTWSNSKGEGKLFSFEVCDETSEIRITAFRDEVDRFYDMIEVDKVYYITGGIVKVANKQFNTLKHDYEITLSRDTQISQSDESGSIPSINYNFESIENIASMEKDKIIDVIGVCNEASECVNFTSRAGRSLTKRELTLVDQSTNSITFTLWGKEAEEFDGSSKPVIAIKGAKISEFMNSKSLTGFAGTMIRINPDIPEAYQLRGWFDNTGKDLEIHNISKRVMGGVFNNESAPLMTLGEAKQMQANSNADRLDFSVLATIMLIRAENCVYKACPKETCNKKVIEMNDSIFRCDKCSQDYPNFKYNLLMSVQLADYTDYVWVTIFSADARKILDKTAQEIGEMMEASKSDLATYISTKNFQTFLFKCRNRIETYNDEERLRTMVNNVEPASAKIIHPYLIEKLKNLTGIGDSMDTLK